MQHFLAQLHEKIDHTLLKPEATKAQIFQLCQEALDHQFFGVCVNSMWVPLAFSLLKGTQVKVISVVGFPLGVCSTDTKTYETKWVIHEGAEEIDMVMPIGPLKERNIEYVLSDLSNVIKSANKIPVKVIIETNLLTDEEKELACNLSVQCGAAFVKTSTGFLGGGADVKDIILMKKSVGSNSKIKASGGIKTLNQVLDLLKSGADRIGTSSGVSIINELKSKHS